MLIVLYRWRIKLDKEKQFIEAWSEITAYYRDNFDSLGSRLHRGNDGLFYSYAQWKFAEDREKAFAATPKLEVGNKMREAITESFPEVILEIVSDYLLFSDLVKEI